MEKSTTLLYPEQQEKEMRALCTTNNTPNQPRFQNGSWIGDSWIPPPGWHLHTVAEIQDTFRGRSVLWIGDSTARRAAASLYAILNHTHEDNGNQTAALSVKALDDRGVINVNKQGERAEPCQLQRYGWDKNPGIKHRPTLCRPMPNDPNHDYLLVDKLCFRQLQGFLLDEIDGQSNLTAHANLIVVSLGIWHNANPAACIREGQGHMEQVKNVLEALYQFQAMRPDATILWRTTGFTDKKAPDISMEIDKQVMDTIDQRQHQASRISYVQWGGAIQPRSFGQDRLKGNNPSHYGLQAHLVPIQMIANTLKQRQGMGGDNSILCQ